MSTDQVVVGVGPVHAGGRRPRRPGRVRASGWPTTRSPRSPAAATSSTRSPRTTEPHYGVSTGFGALATRHIPVERRAQLQRSLIRSHAAGTGPEVEREVVRALMLLRLSTLATGRTGVRPATAAGLRRAARRRHHPGRARVRLARLLGRPRAAVDGRAGAHGRGRGPRRARRAAPRRRGAAPRPASSPVAAGREGGPRAHQRHRRHARHAGAGPRRPAPAAARPPTSPRR